NPNGTVTLVKTTTLAGYRYGVEHYITVFKFDGGGAKFGSIVPLPAIPSKIRRGGDWTLQRLVREVAPPPAPNEAQPSGGRAEDDAKVVKEKVIDSVRVQILKGGGDAVGRWAKNEGFALPPDAPEVLDFYAKRSQIFMALRFIPKEAEESGKTNGDGVPIHLNIRTDQPWVPLRILGLGQTSSTFVEADVFLLTKRQPALLPKPAKAGSGEGMILERDELASQSLLDDLRSDKGGMEWVHPKNMWLTYLRLNLEAGDLTYDLATNIRGGQPNADDTGEGSRKDGGSTPQSPIWMWGAASLFGVGSLALTNKVLSHKD
ncbi:MAG TPA: DUF2330 domain-containing protein, partial [Actinomycetota bacterium]|nr:DUF2330 domain-containing protein [Actinomycetota bacterium]